LDIESLISHKLLQPPVLVFQVLEALRLAYRQFAVLRFPVGNRGIADPLLSAKLIYGHAGFAFLQDADDLL
jgi:hypothetical protein